MMGMVAAKLCVLIAMFSWARAFYLPGLAATNFCEKKVEDLVSKGTCKVGFMLCDVLTGTPPPMHPL